MQKKPMLIQQPFTYYYLIECDDKVVGAIRVVDKMEEGKAKRISPIFVLEQFRNRGIAQAAIITAEKIHGNEHWELDTILGEKGNCYLYEKMGYYKTGKTNMINDRLTLVHYKK